MIWRCANGCRSEFTDAIAFVNHQKHCEPPRRREPDQTRTDDPSLDFTSYERGLIRSKGMGAALRAQAGRRRFSQHKKGA